MLFFLKQLKKKAKRKTKLPTSVKWSSPITMVETIKHTLGNHIIVNDGRNLFPLCFLIRVGKEFLVK